MPIRVSHLDASDVARMKLGARGGRFMLIGRTDGGRVLTLVIERTLDPNSWEIVTGWTASPSERKVLGR
jgi:hypothetical protein